MKLYNPAFVGVLLLIFIIGSAVEVVIETVIEFVGQNIEVVFLILALIFVIWIVSKVDKAKQEEARKALELRKKQEKAEAEKKARALAVQRDQERRLAEKANIQNHGKKEDFLCLEMEAQGLDGAKIEYFFSTEHKEYTLLIYRCRDSIPHDYQEARQMVSKGRASIIHRRTHQEFQHQRQVTRGFEHVPKYGDRFNGRLHGEIIDHPGTGNFYYCGCLEYERSNAVTGKILDGRHFNLKRYYSQIEREEYQLNQDYRRHRLDEKRKNLDSLRMAEKDGNELILRLRHFYEGIKTHERKKKDLGLYLESLESEVTGNDDLSEDEKEFRIDMLREEYDKIV